MTTKTKAKDLQNDLKESVHKIWLAGIGALATAEEEGSKLFNSLVERGESYESKSKKRWEEMRSEVKSKVDEATDKARGQAGSAWDKVEDRVDEAVSSALHRAGVPTRDEIATLTKRVDELIKTVEKLQDEKKPAAAKSSSAGSKTAKAS